MFEQVDAEKDREEKFVFFKQRPTDVAVKRISHVIAKILQSVRILLLLISKKAKSVSCSIDINYEVRSHDNARIRKRLT